MRSIKSVTLAALGSFLILLAARPGVAQQTGAFPLGPSAGSSPAASQNRVAWSGTVAPGAAQQMGPFPLAPSAGTSSAASQNRVAQFGTVRSGATQGPVAPGMVVPPAIPKVPFSDYQPPPAISPWTGLYQFNRNRSLPDYYQYVRPRMQQEQMGREIVQQQRSIQDLQTASQLTQKGTEVLQAETQGISTAMGYLAGQARAQQQLNREVETASQTRGDALENLASLAAGQQQVIQAIRAGETVPDATIEEMNSLAKKVLKELEDARKEPPIAPSEAR